MIRYRYVTHLDPPAPFVNVSVSCPTTGSWARDIPAQVDCAADRTVLPGAVVSALGLVQVGRFLFEGFGGTIMELPVYLVAIQVHDLPPLEIRAVVGEKSTGSARRKASARRLCAARCGAVAGDRAASRYASQTSHSPARI